MVMRSEKTGVGAGSAWRGGAQYNAGLNLLGASYTSLGETFRDELGFIPREGVDIVDTEYTRRWRPKKSARLVREYRWELGYLRYTTEDGRVQSATLSPTAVFDLVEGSIVTASYVQADENLTAAFRPQGIPAGQSIPAGRYVFGAGDITLVPQNGHIFGPIAAMRLGDYYNGTRRGYTAGGRVRFSPNLATTLTVSRDYVRVPGVLQPGASLPGVEPPGVSFQTTLASLRIDASFSTRMFLNAFIQYNSVTRQVLSNIRYDFIHHPLSDIYITYNDTRDRNGLLAPTRQLLLKMTHLLSF